MASPVSAVKNTNVERGVNLFGGWQGIYQGSHSAFATPEQLDYFKSKGLNTFRVGIAWQLLQPTLNGPFDATYLAKMDALVAAARARGQKIAFVPLPGLYRDQDVATSGVPQAAFNDFWKKMAEHYKDEPAIWGYDLINEPNMGDTWNTQIAPSAIAAIRTVDMKKPIIVPTSTGGYGHNFKYHLAGLPMTDPANNLIYQAHVYFDTPQDGRYPNGWDVPNNNMNIGIDNIKDFVQWCETNNQECFVGEYGVPGGWKWAHETCAYDGGTNKDPRWLTVLDNFLTYLDEHKIHGTYWAGGPYEDINGIGPFCDPQGKFYDAPQMAILTKHLGTNANVSPTVSPSPSASPTSTPVVSPSPSLSPTPTAQVCPSDINLDNKTNLLDFNLLATDFMKTTRQNPRTDINSDGTVNLLDFHILAMKFGKFCGE